MLQYVLFAFELRLGYLLIFFLSLQSLREVRMDRRRVSTKSASRN